MHRNWTQWCDRQITETELTGVSDKSNIGLACGKFTTAIDIDDEAVLRLIGPQLLQYGPVSKVGQNGRTDIFRTNLDAPEPSRKFRSKRNADGHRTMLVEILATGNQTVLPPSIHPDTGKPYEWCGRALWDVPHSQLGLMPGGLVAWIEAVLLANGLIDDPAAEQARCAERVRSMGEYEQQIAANRPKYENYVRDLLARKSSALRTLTTGRHMALIDASTAVGPYVALGLLSEQEVETAFRAACEANGFFERELHPSSKGAEKEFHRQIDAGLARGERLPPVKLRKTADEMFGPVTVGGVTTAPEAQGGSGQFLAYLPKNTFYHRPTGQFWPAESVNNVLGKVPTGSFDEGGMPKSIKATQFIARNHGVHQLAWWPGAGEIIEGWAVIEGGWVETPGNRVLNTYRSPIPPQVRGDGDVSRWLNHLRIIFPQHVEVILDWMAFTAQNPTIKVNWALVWGGMQGIGKDSMFEPLNRAVGEWNWQGGVTPDQIMDEVYNDYLECRVLVINEAKDTGDGNRFQFYDKTKTIITAPPKFHSIRSMYMGRRKSPNLNSTIITTNHRTGALYLPADDRRHYVMFSDVTRERFDDAYWVDMWDWLDNGGADAGAAFLLARDVSQFSPKAPPIQTPEFWEMVGGGQPAETTELSDIIDLIPSGPFSVSQLAMTALTANHRELYDFLINRANGTKINRALTDLGIIKYRNPDAVKDGRWLINGVKVTLYKRP